jgi:hypothetical protein
MHIGHDPVIATHARYAGILRSTAIECAKLANRVVITNFQPRRLAGEFLVLRNFTQRRELKNPVVGTNARMPGNDCMWTELVPSPISTNAVG